MLSLKNKKKYLYKPKHLIEANKELKKLQAKGIWNKIKNTFRK